jgi:hypothetical protein
MVHDLLGACFDIDSLPPGRSIEDLFHDSIVTGNPKPLEELWKCLAEADNFITRQLNCADGRQNNAYLKFLRDFPSTPLLTFNYGSLPEILLSGEGTWNPTDGYGVTVRTGVGFCPKKTIIPASRRHVLHLHGTFCVYPAKFEIVASSGGWDGLLQHKDQTDFYFDPDNLVGHFQIKFPFEAYRPRPNPNFIPITDRVIAPVPDKSKGLKGEFVKAAYCRAIDWIRGATQIVAIGYSFNRNDLSSYSSLLDAAEGKSILLVAPDAASLINRLRRDRKKIRWAAERMLFKDWVRREYPGLEAHKCFA